MNGEEQMNQFPITDKPSKGPVLGIAIIIILIVLGGIYILTSRKPAEAPSPLDIPDNQDVQLVPDLTDLEMEAQSLDSDLQALDQLDAGATITP